MLPNSIDVIFRRLMLSGVIISVSLSAGSVCADDIQFNTDVLDVHDQKNIDLKKFSRSNYIMPGNYTLTIKTNNREFPDQSVDFYALDNDDQSSQACITTDLAEKLALKPEYLKKITWWHENTCLDPESLKGMTVRGDLSKQILDVNIPQAYLEYSSENWDPPSQWDDGIPGVLFDYNTYADFQNQKSDGSKKLDISGNGTLGANLGAWRMRADWQGRYEHSDGDYGTDSRSLDMTRYYAYRALPQLGAQVTVGEDYLNSDIFDGFRYAGMSLITDDSMLPPNLRGYAPEVTGNAKTNAKVTISQDGRVLHEEQVAAGPFRIQDINNSVSGKLDIRVEEQDGTVQTYQMDTASIPYLTRPGTVRYKLAAGRPTDENHAVDGAIFASGEGSWGVSNGWSMYGGGEGNNDYQALAWGVGRDLLVFGAISFDVTSSRAAKPNAETLSGSSYRVSYSKNFDEYDSQITFAGYRFSEKDYMSMSQYLDWVNDDSSFDSGKEMYTVTFNKQFVDLGLSIYLNYNHQTYWDAPTQDRYNLTLARYFDFMRFKNMSITLSAYKNDYTDYSENGMYLSMTVPWGSNGTLSYNGTFDHGENIQQASYFSHLKNNDSWQVSAGEGRSGSTASGFYSHESDIAQMDLNASYQENNYSSLGMTLQGGATATLEGAALHRTGVVGGTRMLLDTSGVSGVPIQGNGTHSNMFGKAVVADINSYSRSSVNIDLNELPDNAEAERSVVEDTLTEGAIGYRRFSIIAGEKAMAKIRLPDGGVPPFGATVTNSLQQNVGIVNDDGSVFLNGIKDGEKMTVHWDDIEQCELSLPEHFKSSGTTDLLLPCTPLPQKASGNKSASAGN